MKKETKKEIIYNLAKKSIVLKPLVFNKIYRVSDVTEKNKVKKTIEKYHKGPKLNKTQLKHLRRDLIYCLEHYGITYEEYFLYNFIKNNSHKQRKDFIVNSEKEKYFKLLGTKQGKDTLTDKYSSYLLFKKYYKREIIKIHSKDDYNNFKDYIKKHPIFVKKPLDSSFGKEIELLNRADYKSDKELFEYILKSKQVILEEQILQEETMASLHPSSLNTIRIITYNNNGNITVHLPFIKIGQKESFVDNGDAGGILAKIDEKTGTISTDGKDELNNIYKVHPDTDIKLKGFKIPNWDELKKIAIEAAKDFTDIRYIGWDVALSKDKGPVIVEANGRTQFYGQQITDEVGKKSDLEQLINYKKLKKTNKGLYDLETEYKYKFTVIIPIYNLEKFLKESINSIIKQTIGFKNIQLILVNDGSTDNSENICKKYQKKYPKNITYLKKENGGVSSARNEGIPYIEGRYVNFFDGDDIWEKDAFEKIWNLFQKNSFKVDVIACRQKCFEKNTEYASLDYKFSNKNTLVNINSKPTYIQCSVCSAFIKEAKIKDNRFDERLKFGEDSKFINQIILEKEKYCLAGLTIHNFRKRKDNSSATQNRKIEITRYTNTVEHYYKYFYDYSLKKYNKLTPYIQHLILNALKYRVKENLDNVPKETKDKYIKEVISLIKKIDDEIILKTRNVGFIVKLYLLELKHGDISKDISYEDGLMYYKGIKVSNQLGGAILNLENISIKNNKCKVTGNLSTYKPYKEIELYLKTKKNETPVKIISTDIVHSFNGEPIKTINNFEVEFKLNRDKTKFDFQLKQDNKAYNKIALSSETGNFSILNTDYLHINKKFITKTTKNSYIIKNYKILRVLKYLKSKNK